MTPEQEIEQWIADLCQKRDLTLDSFEHLTLKTMLLRHYKRGLEASGTLESVIAVLMQKKEGQTRPDWLRTTESICEDWGPVVLYWAHERLETAETKLRELGYVPNDAYSQWTKAEEAE